MDTIEVTIYLDESIQEYLIAELSDMDFRAFVQEEEYLKAYISAPRWNDVSRESIEQWLAAREQRTPLQERVVADQNWNRAWEETVGPVEVGHFLIKPTWASVPQDAGQLILLEIDPKMSFGTGYHESTRLALEMAPRVVEQGDRVLDAGTGTGVLAIAALKIGAESAVAFDTDEWAAQNAPENFLLNSVSERIRFVAGSLDAVEPDNFDVILANIDRNTILGMLPDFRPKATPGARLVLSGLLVLDRERMVAEALKHGFGLVEEMREGEWWAGSFVSTDSDA